MTELVYSPASLIGVFTNALNNETTKKLLLVRGVYVPGKGAVYSGLYYDSLRDENTDAFITLVVSAALRHSLVAQRRLECTAYVSKRVQPAGARVELLLNVVEVIGQAESVYTPEQLAGFGMLQKKATLGYKDVDTFIKTKIINDEPIKVTIITGRSGIVDSDIKHQLGEAISEYTFKFAKFNLGSDQDVINALKESENDCDILAIARGGGERLELLNKASIAEVVLNLKPYFLTAIGHEQDVTLVQKMADKSFITPSALGSYFNNLHNSTIDELQNSKAKLVADITESLRANYDKQVSNLNEKIQALEEISSKSQAQQKELSTEKIDLLNNQLLEIKKSYEEKVLDLRIEKDENTRMKNKLQELQSQAAPFGSQAACFYLLLQ